MAPPARNNGDAFAGDAKYRPATASQFCNPVQARWNNADPEQAYPEQPTGGRRQYPCLVIDFFFGFPWSHTSLSNRSFLGPCQPRRFITWRNRFDAASVSLSADS